METEETRAEIARRRLAQLVASFEDHVPPASDPRGPAPTAAATTAVAENASGPVRSHVRRRVTQVHVRLVGAVAVAGVVLLAWYVLSDRPQSVPAGTPDTSVAGLTAGPAGPSDEDGPVETGDIVVDVAGHVQRPGIVTLPAGSRVHEAIEAAGGLVGVVDTTTLNLARKLVDGEQVLVGVAPVAPVGAPGPAGGAINLNTATVEDLDELPGVGPVTAQSIVDWRTDNGPFRSVEDLLEVRGIGEGTLSDLRDLVTV